MEAQGRQTAVAEEEGGRGTNLFQPQQPPRQPLSQAPPVNPSQSVGLPDPPELMTDALQIRPPVGEGWGGSQWREHTAILC